MKLSADDIRAIAAAVVDELERRGLAVPGGTQPAAPVPEVAPPAPMHPDAVELFALIRARRTGARGVASRAKPRKRS